MCVQQNVTVRSSTSSVVNTDKKRGNLFSAACSEHRNACPHRQKLSISKEHSHRPAIDIPLLRSVFRTRRIHRQQINVERRGSCYRRRSVSSKTRTAVAEQKRADVCPRVLVRPRRYSVSALLLTLIATSSVSRTERNRLQHVVHRNPVHQPLRQVTFWRNAGIQRRGHSTIRETGEIHS